MRHTQELLILFLLYMTEILIFCVYICYSVLCVVASATYCCHCDRHCLLLLPLWPPLPAASAIVSATTCLPAVAVLLLYDHSVSWNISFFPSQSYIIFLFCLSVCMSVYVCVCVCMYVRWYISFSSALFLTELLFFFCVSVLQRGCFPWRSVCHCAALLLLPTYLPVCRPARSFGKLKYIISSQSLYFLCIYVCLSVCI